MGTPALETRVELSRNRLETMLKVLDVDGAVRRVRGGWEATGQPWAYDAERYARVPRGPRARAAGDARLPRHRPAAGCGSCASSSTTPRPPTAAGATTAAASSLDATVSSAAVEEAGSPAGPPGRADRAAQDVADRAGHARHRPQGQDRRAAPRRAAPSPGSPTSATARRCGRCSGRTTADGPVPVPLVQAVLDAARRLAPRGRRDRGGGVRDPADADRRPGRRAVPPAAGAGGRPLGDRRPRRRAGPGRGQLRPAGRRRRPPVVARRPTSPRAARCCWSTTRSSPAGR